MQRAMAAEAEASRDARAKVIAAEGEKKSATALKEASDVISSSPSALQVGQANFQWSNVFDNRFRICSFVIYKRWAVFEQRKTQLLCSHCPWSCWPRTWPSICQWRRYHQSRRSYHQICSMKSKQHILSKQ